MNPVGNLPPAATRQAGSGRLRLACLVLLSVTLAAQAGPDATNLWSFHFARSMPMNDTLSTPAMAPDGTIYAGAFDGKFHALTHDGKELWRYQAGSEIKSSPAVADDGTIYFGSRDHLLYALTPAGKLKWKFATDAWVDSSPGIAADGTVYFGSWDKNFYAVNPDGTLKWKYTTGGIVDSSPAIAVDGTIYFGSHDKKFYALDPGGKLRWSFATEAEIASSPAVGGDGNIYFASTDGNLYRLGPDGAEIWRCRVGGGSDSSPVLADNGIIALSAGRRALIVSSAGVIVWSWPAPNWMDEAPAAGLGTICFHAPWAHIFAFDLQGKFLWAGYPGENPSSSLVLGSDGCLYFACEKWVKALRPPSALPPAQSTWPMYRANPRHTGRVAEK